MEGKDEPPKKVRFLMKVPTSKKNYKDAHMPESNLVPKWKFVGIMGAFTCLGLFFLLPIIVEPFLHIDKYKKRHKEVQTELYQAGILPGQLKPWKSPFESRDD